MRKAISILLLTIIFLITASSFSGCNIPEENLQTEENLTSLSYSSSAKAELVGKWVGSSSDSAYIFIFFDDGQAIFGEYYNYGISGLYGVNYSIMGNLLGVFAANTALLYEYTINGNNLTMTNMSNSDVITYTKEK